MTNTFDLTGFSLDELSVLEEQIKAERKSRREEAREAEKAAKAERAERNMAEVSEGDIVTFLFGRGKNRTELTGKVVRVNSKTVTVRSDEFDGKDTRYVNFSRILSITGASASDESNETEEPVEAAV
ncbi:MAG: hypothetical protein ACOC22_01695 [bacterium]